MDQAERVSLMYGLGMNNNGTGLVLASLVLVSYPRVMVSIIFYSLVQHLVAGSIHVVTSQPVSPSVGSLTVLPTYGTYAAKSRTAG